ncbi:GNAT family N-acetyltransferase [Pararhodobacter zhoushanensis]|uniref:GNAT family N-acetyltransferase n=1 Tax=Pararhodobacter zhoushanensis TaxID=2479545 RepID=A0ABT3GTF4_9RHOB|nr:GNAT family N-acetyltransferase [Pararhodobacter zhoushanensis]MCW1930816.1 GNAT family N-acetyltransferase [Pararhodobacter zhoushanensis]
MRIIHGIPPDQIDTAAALYWQAFGGKLGRLMRPEEKALRFFAQVIVPAFAISAVDADGQLLGLAGFKTDAGGLVAGGLADLARVYGWPGALWRGPLLALLERELEPGVLQMDGICVSAQARGQGVGTALLAAIKERAAQRGDRVVRLDVINTNPRAEALYRREGFAPVSRESLGPFRWLFGFSSALRMEFPVAGAGAR